jgi:hypothetical protein
LTTKDKPEALTIDHLAHDIRQLALEVNNVAITVSALIEVLSVDKGELRKMAQGILTAAVAEAERQKGESSESDPLSRENINASGTPEHPTNAAIFGGE